MTVKKFGELSKKVPGHFQDKTLKIVNSRTFPGFPGRVDTWVHDKA